MDCLITTHPLLFVQPLLFSFEDSEGKMRDLLYHPLMSLVFLLISSLQVFQVSSSPLPIGQHRCLHDQRSTLQQLRQDVLNHSSTSTEFSVFYSPKVKFWYIETDCCSWDGVTCDAAGHVIGLDLSHSMLSGGIHSILGLAHLQQLNLAGNDFELTPIPSGLDKLGNLTHINLASSCFSGQIPPEISRLTRLVSLDLSSNSYPFPLKLEEPNLRTFIQNLTSLKELILDNVDLSAEGANWGETLSHALPNLQVLSLSNCRLSGSIHPALSQLHFLSTLRLHGNSFSALVPSFLANFSHLTTLGLASCYLHGGFPKNVFLLPNLTSIDISDNVLLSGQLPEFSKNNNFKVLSLDYTNFSGTFPKSISNLKFLTILRVRRCSFSGSIPSSLANLTRLVELDLSENSFIGSIPPFHRDGVPDLAFVYMSSNVLKGELHSTLFSLPSMKELHLDENQFNGQLEEFPNASSSQLEAVYLNKNQLQGPIPRSFSRLLRLRDLSLANNDFNGTIKLDMFQNHQNLWSLDLSCNNLSIESYSSNLTFPSLVVLGLSSCNIAEFPEFLRNQTSLARVDLSNNQIRGYVPSWMWKSRFQSLDLSHNAVDFLEPPFGVPNGSMPILNGNEISSILYDLRMRSCNVCKFPNFLKYENDLQYLDLSDNKIHGHTPSWIWKMKLFHLNLSHNFLDSLEQLQIHDLHGNFLQGSFPMAICNSSHLAVLDSSHNHFNGLIPECLGKIGTLLALNLEGNNFHGMLPNFALASNLRSLNINGNQLEGKLPRSLANCTNLEVLNLGNNNICDTFPLWLEKLPALKVLVLRANRLYGPIEHPSTNYSFPLLRIMDLSSNGFTGSLPIKFFQSLKAMSTIDNDRDKSKPHYLGDFYFQDSVTIMNKWLEMELVRILTIYTSLDLSNNSFQGEIPVEIGDLKSLIVLNLSRNDFTGRIPSSLGNLTELESLDLSSNELAGNIPPQLASLTSLEVLDLSHNQLTGRIPQGNQFDTFSNASYEGNAKLCGLPLSRKCEEADGAMPAPSQGESSEASGIFHWKVVMMGYGSGLVIGFSIGYIILSKIEDERFMDLVRLRRKQTRRPRRGRKLQS